MADDFGYIDDYSPGLTLQLREKRKGGGLCGAIGQVPDRRSLHRELIVLIHGYNNDWVEAQTAYLGFRNRQQQLWGEQVRSLNEMLADLFWPGDAEWGVVDFADPLYYPAAVHVAKQAAPRLAAYLRSLPNLLTVHFLGHSLGCRLVLETVEELARAGGLPNIGKICLMAAAVPVFQVENDGALANAMRAAQQVLVLHSERDKILRFAFPPGQTLAGAGEGVLPSALGLNKPPPTLAGRVASDEIPKADHGDYWGHSKQLEINGVACARVADYFGLHTAARAMPERQSAATSTAAEARPQSAPPRRAAKPRQFGPRSAW